MSADWFSQHASEFSGALLSQEPLAKHSYYRIGGPARWLAIPKSVEDLKWLARGLRESGLPHFVIGLGSNLLASDDGFDGLVIKTGRIDLSIELGSANVNEGEISVRCGTSVAISTFLRRAAQEGWGGFEAWTGIPGSVGGAVFMNAGTHLGETADFFLSAQIFSFNEGIVREVTRGFTPKNELFHYRENLFLKKGEIVISAQFLGRREDPAQVKKIIDETLARRKATQPIDLPSCGSVFKNPPGGNHAWQVIDRIGLRGHQIGGAQFSPKHCNFIVNLGRAKSADVSALIDLAKTRAQEKLGITLEEEVKYLPYKARQ